VEVVRQVYSRPHGDILHRIIEMHHSTVCLISMHGHFFDYSSLERETDVSHASAAYLAVDVNTGLGSPRPFKMERVSNDEEAEIGSNVITIFQRMLAYLRTVIADLDQ